MTLRAVVLAMLRVAVLAAAVLASAWLIVAIAAGQLFLFR